MRGTRRTARSCGSVRPQTRESSGPGQPDPTAGRDAHHHESEAFFRSFENKLDNDPYRVMIASGEWSCTIARWQGKMIGPWQGLDGKTLKAERDPHLRTNDFFSVERFPVMTFRSTSVTVKDKAIRLVGDLTIRDRTKPVVIEGTYRGRFPDPWGKTRTAFIASTKINRQDFGVAFNGPFEQIGQIGDVVDIEIAIEAVQQ